MGKNYAGVRQKGMPQRTTYSPEIDGLRAIAIVSTCLFHFEIGGADGGFLGIPIFFVISGYLVGGIVFRTLKYGEFRLATFWRRRLTRILPALLVVSATVLFTGYFILLPEDYARTASSIRASLLIHANHQLFGIQDYFGPGKYETHFLHSWSLSVEEQFYLLLPAFVWALVKFPRWTVMLLCGAVASGFALYLWGRFNHPYATHYFLVTRAWELLVGVLVFGLAHDRPQFVRQPTLLACCGLAMTVIPIFIPQGDSTLFNIAMHLSVVTGTALIIFCIDLKGANLLTPLLASAPMRGLGLISYSLYLVHWPLLTLTMYYWIAPIPPFGRVVLFTVSILIAWACWRWIENPLRSLGNAETTSDRQVFLASAISVAAVFATAQLVVQFQGAPGRINEQSMAAAKGAADFSPFRSQCHSNELTNPVQPAASCLLGKDRLPATVAVWGDSHGVELAYALAGFDRFRVRQLTSSSCPPLLDIKVPSQSSCAERNSKVLAYLSNHPEIRTVVLAQHFFGYDDIGQDVWMAGLDRTVVGLKKLGRTVILVGPLPNPRQNVPSSIARSIMFGRNDYTIATPRSTFHRETSSIIAALRRIDEVHDADFVDVEPVMCKETECPFAIGRQPLFFDDNHLSVSGARIVAMRILPSVERRQTTTAIHSPN
jgi:peptidoglycan/LPS O-acetylase OafA/YrhL